MLVCLSVNTLGGHREEGEDGLVGERRVGPLNIASTSGLLQVALWVSSRSARREHRGSPPGTKWYVDE
jgi:hypothetical protein